VTSGGSPGQPLGRVVLGVALGAVVAFVVSWFSSATLGIALGGLVLAVVAGPALVRRRE
jgi:hypothetical protein